MAIMNIFKTTTKADSPLDASLGDITKSQVSDFVTIQSFSNFAVMTGAITAAWHALQMLTTTASSNWVPFAFAFIWAIISCLISIDGLKIEDGGKKKLKFGILMESIFVAVINSLVLAGAVIGTNIVTTP